MISTYRPSKNFEIINDVIPHLENDKFDYEFHITIHNDDFNNLFRGKERWIKNHGHTDVDDCPKLYNLCDAMFLPSHLECFSASYPEAMKMKKPILTSDLSFARAVCGNAALYFNNTDPKDIATKIKMLFNDRSLFDLLIKNGSKKLNSYLTSTQQALKYLDICKSIAEKQ